MKVGFVGLGVMGSGMAANLIAKGSDLIVFARTPSKARRHLDLGAVQAASLEELGRQADVVVLSLPDTRAVESVLFDAGGLADGLSAGSVVVDTSTIDASATRRFAERLNGRGVVLLDAPVSGGQKGAEAGTLVCMVGGSRAAFDRTIDVFRAFASTVTYIGESGAGQLCKTCNQICVIASMLGAAEMVALCQRAGVDPDVIRQTLLGGSARSAVLENHTTRLIARAFEPGFRAELLLKDLRIALDVLREYEVFAPSTSAAEPLFEAMVTSGRGGMDWSAVGLLHQERSGSVPGSRP